MLKWLLPYFCLQQPVSFWIHQQSLDRSSPSLSCADPWCPAQLLRFSSAECCWQTAGLQTTPEPRCARSSSCPVSPPCGRLCTSSLPRSICCPLAPLCGRRGGSRTPSCSFLVLGGGQKTCIAAKINFVSILNFFLIRSLHV